MCAHVGVDMPSNYKVDSVVDKQRLENDLGFRDEHFFVMCFEGSVHRTMKHHDEPRSN